MNDELDDTPETAPPTPKTEASISSNRARELRESPQFKKLKREFRAEGARGDAQHPKGFPCWLCGNDIDYSLRHPNPLAWSLDHAKTVKHHPELIMDRLNFRHSHLDCNVKRGTDAPTSDLGIPSEDW